MVRESVVHLILFIAVVSITTASVGLLVGETSLYAGSVLDEAERDAAAVDAEIEIVNDPAAGTTYDEDTETVTLYVKNVGGSTLDPERADVLLDGEYVEPRSTRVIEGDDWLSGRVVEITLDAAFETGDHRAVVEIDGARDVLEFEHRVAYWQDPSGEPGTSDCDAESCTVDAGETETLDLVMGTDPIQDGESIAYAVNDTTVATVDPDSGVTNASGQNETALVLRHDGTVNVTLDAGWDEDTITITVVNATDTWLQFGFDDRNTAYHPTTAGPKTSFTDESGWPVATGAAVNSSPAVALETVYVGNDNGTLSALNRTSGVERWTFETGTAISSSPTVRGGVVYVADEAGVVYAVDADTGAEHWNASIASSVTFSSPTITGGVLYVGTDDGDVYALDTADGSTVWSENLSVDSITATPTVANDSVYVGGRDGTVYALNASHGGEEWNYTGTTAVSGTAAVANGTVYVGDEGGVVHAIDVETGDQRWNHAVDGAITTSPAVANGRVYVADHSPTITALNESGGVVWNASDGSDAEKHYLSSPAVVNGHVYAVLTVESTTALLFDETNAFVYDASDGSRVVEHAFTSDAVRSSPAVVDNVVYVGDDGGTVHALTEG